MNIFLSFLAVLFSLTAFSQTKTKKLLASCCTKTEGRCTGSASCSACTNCSRCAHCSNGGSCGVCGGRSTQTFYKAKPSRGSTKRKTRNTYTTATTTYDNTPDIKKVSEVRYFEVQSLTTTTENVNLREGPGTNFEILERLPESEIVMIVEQFEEWIQVEVETTGAVGYIYFKYLN